MLERTPGRTHCVPLCAISYSRSWETSIQSSFDWFCVFPSHFHPSHYDHVNSWVDLFFVFCCGFTPHPGWINELSGRHVKGLWKLMWFWVRAEWGISEKCHCPPFLAASSSYCEEQVSLKLIFLCFQFSVQPSSALVAGTCLCPCVFICVRFLCVANKSWTGTNWIGLFGVTQDRIKSWY